MRLRYAGIALLGSLLFFSGCFRGGQTFGEGGIAKNSPAPDFNLKDINGHPLSLSQYKGKVVMLDFWATWCPPCRKEIPRFVQMYDKYKDQGFVVIGVSLDDDGLKAVNPFVKEFKMDYPVAIGNDQIEKAYGGIQGIPTTFIIDRDGKVAESIVGYQDVDALEGKIQKLLGTPAEKLP